MDIQDHSLAGHTAYADLKRLHLDEQTSHLIGTIRRKKIGGKAYLYDTFRIGTKMYDRYIGESTPDVEARLSAAQELKRSKEGRARRMTNLARTLRAEGYIGLDAKTGSLLLAMSRIGIFRLGGTLIGTMAFRLYEGELGVRIGADRLAQTGDVDIASFERLALAIGDTVIEPIGDVFGALSFEPLPSLEQKHVWRWADGASETTVEFLTTAMKGDEELKYLPTLGVSAQALHYMNFLLSKPIAAVALYRSGVLVQIPRPEAFAIHKLIVATRRAGGEAALKSGKDRAQAAFLIDVLARDRPDELAEAYADAMARGPKWRRRIEASLARMPETRERLATLT